ncbi:pseudouridine synthase [Coniochaeta ligniaria NRRL 30616]|uniref:tRNA pseudouridine(55) synthase n=1 Tax=Coniochaeta ligniaria NRRL 30616 TaxID=1408157 RepID=A0A1J7J9J2_9PEZI|nr:pseudouridine synthase [Coniochaeta ligniaria NRRL 30616]
MAKGKVLEGVFAINKPYGMSSAQVIRDCQEYFNPSNLFAPLLQQEAEVRARESKGQQKRRGRMKRDVRVKMGHGGTLDPLATGVLILGVGKGTKALSNFITCTKTYETVVLFGASTDTYDRVGRIVKKSRYDEITRPVVEKALESFRGKYKQMPPLFAALKMDGKPIYEYAREGKPLPREIETREVDVSELEMVEWYEPGTHNHRWPTEEAQESEKYLVNSVWKLGKQQAESGETPKKLTPEQEEQETQALAEWEITKQKADERVDNLIKDKKSNKRKPSPTKPALMSGALGELPPPIPKGRGSNLIPPPPAPGTPPPWEGKGPPAAKLRMTVTSGFYVRSLCHDLGEKLDCGGMMAELVRTRQGEFSLGTEECLEYDELAKGEKVWGPQVETMLSHWMNKPIPGVVDAPKAAESASRKRGLDETAKADGEQASPKRARKNSSSPAASEIKPSIEARSAKSSPKPGRKNSSSPEHSPVKRSIEDSEAETPAAKRAKKKSQSPKLSPRKLKVEEMDAAVVLPSIENSNQPQADGVDVTKVLDAVTAAGEAKIEVVKAEEAKIEEADTAKPSVEEEEWNGIEDEPTSTKA